MSDISCFGLIFMVMNLEVKESDMSFYIIMEVRIPCAVLMKILSETIAHQLVEIFVKLLSKNVFTSLKQN